MLRKLLNTLLTITESQNQLGKEETRGNSKKQNQKGKELLKNIRKNKTSKII